MSPFVQELASVISILLGTIVLTSWAMWILLRPSGDTKTKDFAQESAKDGLTRCVMENNELKNTIKRLERENKVLMSAGYGHKPGSSAEKVEGRAEEPEAKDEENNSAENLVELDAGTSVPEEEAVQEEAVQEEVAELLEVDSIETESAVEELPGEETETGLHKLTDEAEKKKIADYLATVEKATERQKEEIKKLESWKQSGPYRDDNLKVIRGIGPHMEKMLKKAGITSYKQISKFSEEDIRLVSDAIGSFPRRINREQWVEQAKKLAKKT